MRRTRKAWKPSAPAPLNVLRYPDRLVIVCSTAAHREAFRELNIPCAPNGSYYLPASHLDGAGRVKDASVRAYLVDHYDKQYQGDLCERIQRRIDEKNEHGEAPKPRNAAERLAQHMRALDAEMKQYGYKGSSDSE